VNAAWRERLEPGSPALVEDGARSEAPCEAEPEESARAALWPLPVILTAFWIYVALSNVLYARSMSASMDPSGTQHFFAAWNARVLQHLFLYPVLGACIWGSLRIGWKPAWRAWPAQIAIGLFFAGLGTPFLWLGETLLGHDHGSGHVMTWTLGRMVVEAGPNWIASTTSFVLAYGFALALASGFSLYRRYRDAQLRSAALQRAWTAARLAALRMQLSPHTLFNLLHTIRGEIVWDPPAAQSMVVQLADLLRKLLSAGDREFTPLGAELEFVQLYLKLQQRRFADRLRVELPDPSAAPRLWVPSLILQPLIENAVTHGLADQPGPIEIRLELETSEDELNVRLSNSGAYVPAARPFGIGLANVRERLLVHFGERAALAAGPRPEGGWLAEIRMPRLAQPRPMPVGAPASERP